jgi:predicted outer membrane protein
MRNVSSNPPPERMTILHRAGSPERRRAAVPDARAQCLQLSPAPEPGSEEKRPVRRGCRAAEAKKHEQEDAGMRRSIHGMGRVMAIAASVAVLPMGLAAQEAEATDANDRAAHAFMSAVDLGEVQQSMLATQRAASAEVRAYAQQMIGDHTNALHTREMLMQTERSGLLPRMGGGSNNARASTAQAIGGPDVQGAGVSAPDIQGRGGAAQGSGQGNNHAQGTGSTQGTGGPVSAATGGPGIAGQGVATQDIEARGGAQGNHGHQDASAAAHAGHGDMAMGNVTPEMVQQLMTVLQEHPMSRPVMTSNQQNMQVLMGIAAGPQFDRSYMDAQIGAHQYALNNLDRMLQQGGLGSDITSTMRMMRTAVASHLQTAQQIRARLGS